MNPTRMQTQAVAQFQCLGDQCPETCCKGWGMQLMPQTVEKYKVDAPELLEAVTSGEAEFIMRRDPDTDYCVKFDAGWCGIHKAYGEEFLGDACHFYPRITRSLGATVLTSAAMSCPEAARLMLFTPDALTWGERSEVRVPFSLRNVLPAGIDEASALALHDVFLSMTRDENYDASASLMRVSALARAIEHQPVSSWPEAAPLYLAMIDSRIPEAQAEPADMFNLLHALHGLMAASPKQRAALRLLVDQIAQVLGVRFLDGGAVELASDASTRGLRLLAHMRDQSLHIDEILCRYLEAQLSQALFPFAGFGETLTERVTIIGVRFATLRLALSTLPVAPNEAEVVGIVYNVSRFLDHLADPTLSLAIYRETGWVRESRLRALIGE